MSSKHSALGDRILRTNRNKDVILLLETKMAYTVVGSSVERHFHKQRRHFTIYSQHREKRCSEIKKMLKSMLELITMSITQKIQTFAEAKWKTRI